MFSNEFSLATLIWFYLNCYLHLLALAWRNGLSAGKLAVMSMSKGLMPFDLRQDPCLALLNGTDNVKLC